MLPDLLVAWRLTMNRTIIPSVLSLTFWILPASGHAADPAAQLKAGAIVAFSMPTGAGPWPGRAMGVVNASAEVVQEVLANVSDYKAFIPRITASRQVKPGRFVVELDLPWPVNKTWAYVVVSKGERQGVRFVQWKMLNGTLRSYEGTAWIQPWGDKTLLTYQMLAVPKTAAPDSMISGGLRDAASTVIESVRKQTAKLLKQGTIRVAAGGAAS
jgi:hypothetical protein